MSGGERHDIIVFSVGRLVRNLPGQPFPGWSSDASRDEVVEALLPRLLAQPGLKNAFHTDMADLSLLQRRLLLERKLMTPCMAGRQHGCHLIIPRKQDMSIMLNEEEHLVAHFFRPGLALPEIASDLKRFSATLEKDIEFARDASGNYLTSLPAEAGDGRQFYVVMHLPALTLANMAEQITRSLEKLQISISPFYTGMQEDTGNTYILSSNVAPLGQVHEIVEPFVEVVQAIQVRELQMREQLLNNDLMLLSDRVGRAFGRLQYATQLRYEELVDDLSLMRLAVKCRMFEWKLPTVEVLNRLVCQTLLLAPTHLRLEGNKEYPAEFNPTKRAALIHALFAETEPVFKINPTP